MSSSESPPSPSLSQSSPTPMEQWITNHFPVRIEYHPTKGRCVIANRTLEPGTVILSSTFPAYYSMQPEIRCGYCFSSTVYDTLPSTASSASSPSLLRCGNCKFVHYCSQGCQRQDWAQNHKYECKHLSTWMNTLKLPLSDRITLFLLGRIYQGTNIRAIDGTDTINASSSSSSSSVSSSSSSSLSSVSPSSVSATPPIYTHTFTDILSMVPDKQNTAIQGHFDQLLALAEQQGYFSSILSKTGASNAIKNLPTVYDRTVASAIVNAFDTNNFGITDELCSLRAAAVSPIAALLNHACRANCVLSYTYTNELAIDHEIRSLLSGTNHPSPSVHERFPSSTVEQYINRLHTLRPSDRARHLLVIRTLYRINEGDELTHSYVEQTMQTPHRQEYLQATYGFTCTCLACCSTDNRHSTDEILPQLLSHLSITTDTSTASSSSSTDSSSSLSSSRPVISNHAQFSLAAQSSYPSPINVGILRTIPNGLRREAEGDIISDFSNLAGYPTLVTDIKRVQAIISAVELAVGHPELLYDIPDVDTKSLFQQAHKEDAILLRKAEKERMVPIKEGRQYLREIRALEYGLALLRQYLHPLHTQIIQLINMLHERYMIIGDDHATAAANEHLTCYQRHMYCSVQGMGVPTKMFSEKTPSRCAPTEEKDTLEDKDNVPVPIHPMLSLQLFTQGDIYHSLEEALLAEQEEYIDYVRRNATKVDFASSLTSLSFFRTSTFSSSCPPERQQQLATLFVEFDYDSTESDYAGTYIRPVGVPVLTLTSPSVQTKGNHPPTNSSSPIVSIDDIRRQYQLLYNQIHTRTVNTYYETWKSLCITHGYGFTLTLEALDRYVKAVRTTTNFSE